jgi:hypothetical protein
MSNPEDNGCSRTKPVSPEWMDIDVWRQQALLAFDIRKVQLDSWFAHIKNSFNDVHLAKALKSATKIESRDCTMTIGWAFPNGAKAIMEAARPMVSLKEYIPLDFVMTNSGYNEVLRGVEGIDNKMQYNYRFSYSDNAGSVLNAQLVCPLTSLKATLPQWFVDALQNIVY